jgi:dihydrofolate reductase
VPHNDGAKALIIILPETEIKKRQDNAMSASTIRAVGKENTMRKAIFGGASSLDSYFARKDDRVDWLMSSDEATTIMRNYWKSIDTIVMGRKTYEMALRMSEGKRNLYSGMKTYVFSRTLKPQKESNLEIVAGDAVPFLKRLKKADGKDICVMGGGDLARSLFDAGLIDEIGFNIHPVLLGSGIPLFHEMKRQIDLELLDCKRFQNGCVYVSYRVKRTKAKRRKK